MAEWFKVAILKIATFQRCRGFESLSNRGNFTVQLICEEGYPSEATLASLTKLAKL